MELTRIFNLKSNLSASKLTVKLNTMQNQYEFSCDAQKIQSYLVFLIVSQVDVQKKEQTAQVLVAVTVIRLSWL